MRTHHCARIEGAIGVRIVVLSAQWRRMGLSERIIVRSGYGDGPVCVHLGYV